MITHYFGMSKFKKKLEVKQKQWAHEDSTPGVDPHKNNGNRSIHNMNTKKHL